MSQARAGDAILPCPSCRHDVHIPSAYQGTMVQCPYCGSMFQAGSNQPPRFTPVPAVVAWQRAYCACAFVLAASCSCLFGLVAGHEPSEEIEDPEMFSLFVAFLIAGFLFLTLIHAIGIFLPARPWTWWYFLTLQMLGILIGGPPVLIVCILLLVHWVKPEVKEYFARAKA